VIFSKDQHAALLVSKPAGWILNAINYDSGCAAIDALDAGERIDVAGA
jgi:hypothetical protein